MSTTTSGTRTPTRTWLTLLPFLAAVTVVATLGGLATGNAGETYRGYDLPAFAPPSWLFGPVWTVLYAMIAVAGWLVWRAVGWRRELNLWAVQLLLNLAWTPLFFGADLLGWALLEIGLLWVAVIATIALFWRVSRPAAWLLVPYLAWVSYASALNAGIWLMN